MNDRYLQQSMSLEGATKISKFRTRIGEVKINKLEQQKLTYTHLVHLQLSSHSKISSFAPLQNTDTNTHRNDINYALL
jgi:hypothetical protein